MRALSITGVLAVAIVAVLVGTAQAALIAYDGIQYAPGPLVGDGPAFGFLAPWAADPGVIVSAPTLGSLLDLPSMGFAVAGNFNYQAPLAAVLAPTSGKEFWASFLVLHSGPNDQTFMGLSPAGAPFGAPPAVASGIRLGQYGIFVGGTFTPAPVPFTPNGSTDFLVMHFTAGGATWNVQLFVNKLSFAVPDLAMIVAPVTYGTMVNMNEVQFESDEFRLGDTAGDVSAAGVTPTIGSSWGRLKQLYR